MIKVTGSSVADSEVELIVTAARFFLDRLLPVAQQKKLTMKIDITNRPGRTPIAIKWLVGSSGFFRWKPPRYFEMTVSVAAGVQDGLEVAANEIVHVVQTVSGRLKIALKNRKVNGQREEAYAASWINGKFAFIDMTPRDNRLWEAEAHQLKKQLVSEFLAWSVHSVKNLPIQKSKRNGFGLYKISPKTITALATMPTLPDPALRETNQLNDDVDLATNKSDLLADETVFEPQDGQQLPDQLNVANHLDIDSVQFKVAVNVPRLGKDRILDSAILHGKLNDLLERGLIPYAMARAAFRQAEQKRLDN